MTTASHRRLATKWSSSGSAAHGTPQLSSGHEYARFLAMNKVNIADARASLSRYVARVEAGETIVLCRRNVPVAEIRPIRDVPRAMRPVGIDRGLAIPESFFEPLPIDLLERFGAAATGPRDAGRPKRAKGE